MAALTFALTGMACFPGGLVGTGGFRDGVSIVPSATRTRGADYQIVCWDHAEERRRENAGIRTRKKGEKASGKVLGPPVRYLDRSKYRGQCTQEGEHSVFFLLNIFPATTTLSPDYAIGLAVQKLEGDTMINLRFWHETHYFSILGRSEVLKVRGDVIRFKNRGTDKNNDKQKKKGRRKKRRR